MIMNETGFFRLLWRFNAIGIAVALLIAIALSLFAVFIIATDIKNRNIFTHNVKSVDKGAKDKNHHSVEQRYTLGSPKNVSGHDVIYMPLNSVVTYDPSLFSKSTSSYTVNYAFFDITSLESYWLFYHRNFLIISMRELYTGSQKENNKVVDAYIYSLVKEDTNNDGKLTSSDNITVAISDPRGKSYTELLPSVRELMGFTKTRRNGREVLALTYKDNEGTHISLVLMENYKTIYKTDISFDETKEPE